MKNNEKRDENRRMRRSRKRMRKRKRKEKRRWKSLREKKRGTSVWDSNNVKTSEYDPIFVE